MGVLGRYCTAATLARLADEMLTPGLILLVLLRTGHPQDVGLVTGAWTLPSLVSGPVFGAWLGRMRQRARALAAGQLVVALSALALVLTVGRTPIVVPVLVAAVGGIAVPGTTGGFTSLVPSLAPGGAFHRLNRMDATTFNLSSIAGPALVGTLAATIGPAQALLIVCAIAAGGSAAALTIPAGEPTGETRSIGIAAAVRAGLRQVVTEPPLRGATLASVLGWGAVGMLMVVLPLYAARIAGKATYSGYLWTALEVGCLISTLTLARGETCRPDRRVLICTAVFGLIMLTWPLAPTLPVALPLLFLAGIASGPTLPALFATRQQYSPPGLLSQVSTTGASLKIGAFALGSVLGGALAPGLGAGRVIVLVAIAQLVGAGLGWLLSRRSRQVSARASDPTSPSLPGRP
ncbi:MAG TPA: MFS transporter [Pseudonocardiaceae bacterium]|nr:MFS transporter [Pseudonocardiaceae bacterium]